MAARVIIKGMFGDAGPGVVVNTTSRGGEWSGLSPFLVGPCELYGGRASMNMENAWQFSKLYPEHAGPDGGPTDAYWQWAESGWADGRAHRYPMGKGRIPLCSVWDGKKLDYVQARKTIYAPLYARAVQKTQAWARLVELHDKEPVLVLRDFDGYDHDALGMTLEQVINEPRRKMGHAFVLKMLLTRDAVLGKIGLQ